MSKEVDPKMHTAEHILNQTMIRLFDCGRCFSAHIEKKKSKCDYHFDRALTSEEIDKIETTINDIISKNLAITEELVPLTEAKEKYNLSRLPEESEMIRIVRVGDYDACPCIGPHAHTTDELVGFRIISSDWQSGVLRIRYKLANETD